MSRGCAERDAVRDEARNDRERQARSLEQPLACEGRGRFVCGQGDAREMDEAGSHPPLPPALDEVNVARRRAGSRGNVARRRGGRRGRCFGWTTSPRGTEPCRLPSCAWI